ncbi:MAG: hypothetical protein GXY27_01965 [Erysipelotrichaceae bacterium]|jgi:hypothetical protein|nr:hypothetical protein [Erysipelotrichaceae bacterium]
MDLNNLKQKLLKLGEKIGLQVQEHNQDVLMLHTAIVAKDYFPEAVYCRLVAYESGTIHLFLTFNEAEKTTDRLFIINNFNENNPWFKAYITAINDKYYLELHYSAYGLNEEDEAVEAFGFMLNALLEQTTVEHIKAILANE